MLVLDTETDNTKMDHRSTHNCGQRAVLYPEVDETQR